MLNLFDPFLTLAVTGSGVRSIRRPRRRFLRGAGRMEPPREERFPPGVIVPEPFETNIRDIPRFRESVRSIVGSVRSRPVALVLPDASGRLGVLDLEAWPDRPAHADMLVIWRLEEEWGIAPSEYRISYRVFGGRTQEGRSRQGPRVLAAAVHEPVVGQYEDVLLEAGLMPVSVTLASCAVLENAERWHGERYAVDSAFASLHLAHETVALIVMHAGMPACARICAFGRHDSGPAWLSDVQTTVEYCDEYAPEAMSNLRLVMASSEDGQVSDAVRSVLPHADIVTREAFGMPWRVSSRHDRMAATAKGVR